MKRSTGYWYGMLDWDNNKLNRIRRMLAGRPEQFSSASASGIFAQPD
jgi:hypothetical protein